MGVYWEKYANLSETSRSYWDLFTTQSDPLFRLTFRAQRTNLEKAGSKHQVSCSPVNFVIGAWHITANENEGIEIFNHQFRFSLVPWKIFDLRESSSLVDYSSSCSKIKAMRYHLHI